MYEIFWDSMIAVCCLSTCQPSVCLSTSVPLASMTRAPNKVESCLCNSATPCRCQWPFCPGKRDNQPSLTFLRLVFDICVHSGRIVGHSYTKLLMVGKPAPPAGHQPLIPERYLDVPSQRLYYLSLGLLLQVSNIYRFSARRCIPYDALSVSYQNFIDLTRLYPLAVHQGVRHLPKHLLV